MMDAFWVLLEVVLVVLAVYCVYRSVRSLRDVAQANSHEALLHGYTWVIGFGFGGAAVLGVNTLLSGRSDAVVLVVLTLSGVLFVSASLIAWVRYRRIEAGDRRLEKSAPINVRRVVIKALVANRVRGLVNGEGVTLTQEDEASIAGTTGFVRMIPWESASKARDSRGFTPLLGFWDGEGTELFLYADDQLVLAPQH